MCSFFFVSFLFCTCSHRWRRCPLQGRARPWKKLITRSLSQRYTILTHNYTYQIATIQIWNNSNLMTSLFFESANFCFLNFFSTCIFDLNLNFFTIETIYLLSWLCMCFDIMYDELCVFERIGRIWIWRGHHSFFIYETLNMKYKILNYDLKFMFEIETIESS